MALIELGDHHHSPNHMEGHRASHPGFDDYLQLSARFLEEV